jgi:hypothetical protein
VNPYQYVSHRSGTGTATYFKVPSGWTLFDQRQLLEAANGPLTSQQVSDLTGQNWSETFSGSPHASASESNSIGGGFPTGYVEVRRLSAQEQDGFSLASLRTEVLPSDPLQASSSGSPFVVLQYSTLSRPGGLRGSSLVVDIKSSTGKVDTLDQVALVDGATQWVYLLAVGCSASCFGANRSVINQVVNSWTVREH